MRWDKGYDY